MRKYVSMLICVYLSAFALFGPFEGLHDEYVSMVVCLSVYATTVRVVGRVIVKSKTCLRGEDGVHVQLSAGIKKPYH